MSNGMANSMADETWNTEAFRSKGLKSIEEAFQRNNVTPQGMSRSPPDLERNIFSKAKTKEEYMTLLGRVIVHIAEFAKKQHMAGGGMGHHGGMGQQGGAGMSQDPINALTNLTRQPGMNSGGQTRGSMQMMQGGPYGGRPRMMSMQPGMQQQMAAQAAMQQANMQQNPMQVPQGMGQRPGMMPGMPPQGMPQQHGEAYMVGPDGMPAGVQQVPGRPVMGPEGMQPNQPYSSNMMMNPNYSMNQGNFAGQGPGGMMQPSPMSQGPGMSPHLQSLQPSPNMMTHPSPQHPGVMGVSPSMTIAPSPGQSMAMHGSMTQEEQMYHQKMRQLQQFIEPLQRMKVRYQGNKEKYHDLRKIEMLLQFLSTPISSTNRIPMEKILKCEAVLESMKHEFDQKPAMPIVPPPPPPVSRPGQLALGQQLYDAVSALTAQPNMNHIMSRAFGTAVQALHGNTSSASVTNPPQEEEEEPEEGGVSEEVQCEVAHLPTRFRIRLDPSYPSFSSTLHLVCHLDDEELPSVPPLYLDVPKDYPKASPKVNPSELYEISSSFLEKVVQYMNSDLLDLPQHYSITKILNIWELSVRRAAHWMNQEHHPEAIAAAV